MKNLIKRIIKEGILSKQRGIIPDMAGKITKGGLKASDSDYVDSGKLNIREELKKLIVKFIYINYGKDELENYRGKLNKFVYGLSDENLTNFDSIFLKAVNNNDEESIALANEFLNNVKSGDLDLQGIARRKQMNKKTNIDKIIQSDNKVLQNKELEALKRQYVKIRSGIKLGEEILNMKNKLKVSDVYYFHIKNEYRDLRTPNYTKTNPPILSNARKFGLIGEPYFEIVVGMVKDWVWKDTHEITYKDIIGVFIDNVEINLDRLKTDLDKMKELLYNKYDYIPNR
jgi:hypothetical protein